MLAGVNVVLMGAGIPRQIPKTLDDLAAGNPTEMRLDVTGAKEPVLIHIDPAEFGPVPQLARPIFLAIVSSPGLAENLRRKSSGRVDGFVVEASIAGGHNPRGRANLRRARPPRSREVRQNRPAILVGPAVTAASADCSGRRAPKWVPRSRSAKNPDSILRSRLKSLRG